MIKFRYQPTFANFWMLNRRHLMVKLRLRMLLPFAVGLLLIFCFSPWVLPRSAEMNPLERYLASWPLLILPMLVGFMLGSVYSAAKKRWNEAEEVRGDKHYEVSDEGIRMEGSGVNGALEWRHVAGLEYEKGWIFITTQQGVYYYFPLTAVTNSGELIELLDRKIQNKKGMKEARRYAMTSA